MSTAPALNCALSESHGVVIVHPIGQLDNATYPHLRDTLLKCAADVPRGVIADIEALEITHDYLVSVFATVWMRVSEWSMTPVVVVPGSRNMELFQRSGTPRYLPVHPTVSEALEKLHEPLPRLRTVLNLPLSAMSVPVALRFVVDTCENWDIGASVDDAIMVADALLDNAVRHGRPPIKLRLELRQGRLTVAVSDGGSWLVQLPQVPMESTKVDGGLAQVARLALVSGCSSAQTGGKIVWAVLRVSRDQ